MYFSLHFIHYSVFWFNSFLGKLLSVGVELCNTVHISSYVSTSSVKQLEMWLVVNIFICLLSQGLKFSQDLVMTKQYCKQWLLLYLNRSMVLFKRRAKNDSKNFSRIPICFGKSLVKPWCSPFSSDGSKVDSDQGNCAVLPTCSFKGQVFRMFHFIRWNICPVIVHSASLFLMFSMGSFPNGYAN